MPAAAKSLDDELNEVYSSLRDIIQNQVVNQIGGGLPLSQDRLREHSRIKKLTVAFNAIQDILMGDY